MESRAHIVQSSPSGPFLSPYEERTPRVSSPDVERALPGPYASTSVTFAPIFWRLRAVKLPQTPAPMTTISGEALADRTERVAFGLAARTFSAPTVPPTRRAPAPALVTL